MTEISIQFLSPVDVQKSFTLQLSNHTSYPERNPGWKLAAIRMFAQRVTIKQQNQLAKALWRMWM